MKCINCQKEIDDDSVFCPECGHLQKAVEKDVIVKNEELKNNSTGNIQPQKDKRKNNGSMFTSICILLVICFLGFVLKNGAFKAEKNEKVIEKESQSDTVTNIVEESEEESLDISFYENALDAINNSMLWLDGTISEDGSILYLQESVNLCALNESGKETRYDDVMNLNVMEDSSDFVLQEMKGCVVRLGGSVLMIKSRPVMLVSKAIILEQKRDAEDIHTYIIVQKDCTWDEAFRECLEQGGYLVRINTKEEWNYITKQIESEKKEKIQFFIGARRDVDAKSYYWVDEDNEFIGERLDHQDTGWCKDVWLDGEPSYIDKEIDASEDRIEMFLYSKTGKWVLNDVPNNILKAVPQFQGRIGYICEIEG
ncbi:MAG: zinc-ribbon domain-containing protein [Lachnospiraceae bacterium]|nr:zinc-ribbon domain-containing protein [Lachnospiraceae bacterium]